MIKTMNSGSSLVAGWVKGPVLLQLKQKSQLKLRFQSLAKELQYAMGVAKKKKNTHKTMNSENLVYWAFTVMLGK